MPVFTNSSILQMRSPACLTLAVLLLIQGYAPAFASVSLDSAEDTDKEKGSYESFLDPSVPADESIKKIFQTEQIGTTQLTSSADKIAESEPLESRFSAEPIRSTLLAAAAPALAAPMPTGGRISADPDDNSSTNNSSSTASIEELNRQILLKEIALEKFNLNYRSNAAKQGRWKGLRYATFAEANSGLGLAGGIMSVYNRGVHVHRPRQVKLQLQKNANLVPMVGNIIGAGAASLEFLINEYHDYEAWKKGFSPGQAKKYVAGLQTDIQRLLDQREALVKVERATASTAVEGELHELEGRVLRDLRDQGLLEFQRFHLNARRTMSFQQMQYFFDLAKNTTGAIGYNFAWLSLHRGRRVWNFRAGVMFTVSGGLTMGGPIASRLFAKAVSEYHKHSLKDSIGQVEARQLSALEADQKALNAMVVSGRVLQGKSESAFSRAEVYGDHSKYFQDQLASSLAARSKARLVATQNIGAGLFVGGSKVASGILFIIPGWYQLYNRSTETSTRITNSLLLTSGIVGLPATSFSIFDTLRIQVQGELERAKLKRAGKLPSQIIQARMQQLNEMEAKLLRQQP